MRILHVLSSADPVHGGTSEFVLNLLRNSPPAHQSELLTLDAPDAPWLRDHPFPIHALGPVATVYGYTAKLRPWLRQNLSRFDGIVVHGLWQYTGLAVRLESSQQSSYVVLPHGMLDPYFQKTSTVRRLKKWLYWLCAEFWVLRGARRAVFTNQEESRLARQTFRLYRWNPAVIPFGSYGPPPQDPLDSFLSLHPTLAGKRFVLFLGRIHPKKGCDLLIEAFARVSETDPGLHLVIAGPDGQGWAAKLQQQAEAHGIAERVYWPGMLSGGAKWGAFRAAEAFILPSHQENFGIAVAEALACSRPVLLTDKINIAREIASDGAGFVEADTVDGVERLLRRWIATSAPDRAKIATQALACFHRRYNMQETANAIVALFEQSPS